jgi:hypothetical protein
MQFDNIPYQKGGDGRVRFAQTIAELPKHLHYEAKKQATKGIGVSVGLTPVAAICCGAPVYTSFGLSATQAAGHAFSELLLMTGAQVPLEYCKLANDPKAADLKDEVVPPFNPRTYSDRGFDFYEDGRVHAEIVISAARLTVWDWRSFHKGRGNSREALKWLRERYNEIDIVNATAESLPFWEKMKCEGYIDNISQIDQIPSELDQGVLHEL